MFIREERMSLEDEQMSKEGFLSDSLSLFRLIKGLYCA
jgi:hypothetical protein